MLHRRDFLLGSGAAFMSALLSQRASAAPPVKGSERDDRPASPKARSIIVLWMNGGPSHLDTWDPKPNSRNGGTTKAIKTRQSDLVIAADMPRLADVADRLCVIRAMSSKEGNHQRAQYLARTSYSPTPTIEHPSLGAWISKKLGPTPGGLPAFVSLGGPSLGAGFLGTQHGPFVVQKAGALPQDTRAPVDDARYARRLALLDGIERRFSSEVGGTMVEDRRALYTNADRFMRSRDITAFDLSRASDAARAAYGDSDFGRGCMTAKNLVAAGVRFVEVTLDGWDTHRDNFTRVPKQLGIVDPAFSALLRDLETTPASGNTDKSAAKLIDSTLVIWMGEFGRTPRINENEGRDHYPGAWSAVMAGAGIKPGILGATDPDGEKVVGKAYAVPDLLATASTLMGLAPNEETMSPVGRPIAVTNFGIPIAEAMRSS